ncbi:prolipoprotein diacylglyceryl transferase [Clostridium oryzae]|uniref:Phosphatidylglycerol--prolipoprotein diacylglyceryl transferase n=1 Tax=Clostridium oryzae TaxID=1450648 RepID=A0A1V4IMM3_9CLOT|nr:prolipoprotein diacylglyceryl transferase [Clostridium oryzae]OPJ61288.1 prolipoprotein diacylglyceryl transferase [Clostridium oryzae]
MRPVLFDIGPLKIQGYGTMIAIGIIAAMLLLNYRAKKKGYDDDKIFNMAFIAVICGVIGSKLLYVIVEINYFIKNPKELLNLGSGFVVIGGIILGAVAVYLYCRNKKWDTLKVIDLITPSVPLAQGFGRIGCFLAGCCYGRETQLRIGVKFTKSQFAPNDVNLIPTQIYSSIFDFALAIFLLYYGRKPRKKGSIFSAYIVLYSIGRFLIEFLRNDPRGSVGVLSTSQFICIFTFIFGIILFLYPQKSE